MNNSTSVMKRVIKNKSNGTLLDGRYEIRRVVGKGGFSVVYEAVNIHTKQRVAVKECTMNEGKESFLREARLLHDFADEEAVVTVIDSFEENDTAYIVMEYVDGITLREHIQKNGKCAAEDTVRLFSPVMGSLSHLHDAGVIHRDISPDNLMVTTEGHLKLLDFGAAHDHVEAGVSKLVFKSCYSPPEQMDEKSELGAYTDVYSLCATIYFCLTGTNPDDIMSRLLLDEILQPSALGSDILPQAEKSLMKGMVLDSKKRTQSVRRLQEELESVYPGLTEEEKQGIRHKKKVRRWMIAAACLAVIVIAGILVNANRLRIILAISSSENIVLDGSNMTKEQFGKNAAIAKARIDALSDGCYLWSEGNKKVKVEVLKKCIEDKDPVDYLKYIVARPMTMYFGVDNGKEQIESEVFRIETYVYVDKISQEDDIQAVRQSGDEIKIVFSENAASRLSDYLSDTGVNIRIAFDIQHYYEYIYYDGETVGDGKTIMIYDEGADDLSLPESLMELILTSEPMDEGFSIELADLNDRIEWDNKSEDFGRLQKHENEIVDSSDNGIACLSYKCYGYFDDDADILTPESIRIAFRSRLDALGAPYSIGVDIYNEDIFWIKMPYDELYYEAMLLMGERVSFKYGSAYGTISDLLLSATPVITDTDREYPEITCEFDIASDVDSIGGVIDDLLESGESKLYLYADDIPIAYTDLRSAKELLKTGQSIIFDHWNNGENTNSDYDIGEFVKSLIDVVPKEPLTFEEGFYTDEYGTILDASEVPFATDTLSSEIIEDIEDNKDYPGFYSITYNKSDRTISLVYSYSKPKKTLYEEPVLVFLQFYERNRYAIESEYVHSVYCYVRSFSEPLCTDENGHYARPVIIDSFVLNKDYRTGVIFADPDHLSDEVREILKNSNVGIVVPDS